MDLIADLYFMSSSLILGNKSETPMRFGTDIAKIIASEKSVTAPKLIEAPIIVNIQNSTLYVMVFLFVFPNKNNHD